MTMLAALFICLISFACGARLCFVCLKHLDRIRTHEEVEARKRHQNHELGD